MEGGIAIAVHDEQGVHLERGRGHPDEQTRVGLRLGNGVAVQLRVLVQGRGDQRDAVRHPQGSDDPGQLRTPNRFGDHDAQECQVLRGGRRLEDLEHDESEVSSAEACMTSSRSTSSEAPLRSVTAWKSSTLSAKWAYTVVLETPARAATASIEVRSKPSDRNSSTAASVPTPVCRARPTSAVTPGVPPGVVPADSSHASCRSLARGVARDSTVWYSCTVPYSSPTDRAAVAPPSTPQPRGDRPEGRGPMTMPHQQQTLGSTADHDPRRPPYPRWTPGRCGRRSDTSPAESLPCAAWSAAVPWAWP